MTIVTRSSFRAICPRSDHVPVVGRAVVGRPRQGPQSRRQAPQVGTSEPNEPETCPKPHQGAPEDAIPAWGQLPRDQPTMGRAPHHSTQWFQPWAPGETARTCRTGSRLGGTGRRGINRPRVPSGLRLSTQDPSPSCWAPLPRGGQETRVHGSNIWF